jgi:hypothetical protein
LIYAEGEQESPSAQDLEQSCNTEVEGLELVLLIMAVFFDEGISDSPEETDDKEGQDVFRVEHLLYALIL